MRAETDPSDTIGRPSCTCQTRVVLQNRWTGQAIKPDCKTWGCPHCGPKKRRILIRSVIESFHNERFLSLWTFTISTDAVCQQELHTKMMQGAWRRFVIKIRQGYCGLSLKTGFKYFRIAEKFKSGFIHFHCMFNRWINKAKVNIMWEACVRAQAHKMGIFLKWEDQVCNANVAKSKTGRPNPSAIAAYVAKYVTKTLQAKSSESQDMPQKRSVKRLWSASRGFVRLAMPCHLKNRLRLWTLHRGSDCLFTTGAKLRLDLFLYRVMLQAFHAKMRKIPLPDDPVGFDGGLAEWRMKNGC